MDVVVPLAAGAAVADRLRWSAVGAGGRKRHATSAPSAAITATTIDPHDIACMNASCGASATCAPSPADLHRGTERLRAASATGAGTSAGSAPPSSWP